MADSIRITAGIAISRDELQFSFARSSGPGGQNVNKVASKATMHWEFGASDSLPQWVKNRLAKLYANRINDRGELVLSSSRHRAQRQNVEDCVEKLRQLVHHAASPPKPRRKTRPPAAAKAKRLRHKRQQSDKKKLRKPPGPE